MTDFGDYMKKTLRLISPDVVIAFALYWKVINPVFERVLDNFQ
jgi:hypothetical protein